MRYAQGAARCRLDEQQLAALDLALAAGPLAAGWDDQRWTVARVRDVVAGRFKVRLIYGLHCYRGRKDETRAFTWTEYRDLLIATHRQLPGGNRPPAGPRRLSGRRPGRGTTPA